MSPHHQMYELFWLRVDLKWIKWPQVGLLANWAGKLNVIKCGWL